MSAGRSNLRRGEGAQSDEQGRPPCAVRTMYYHGAEGPCHPSQSPAELPVRSRGGRRNSGGRRQLEPPLTGASHVSACYPYRDKREGESDAAYVARVGAELEAEIQRLGGDRVIAFVAETVAGATLGAAPPVPGYFRRVRGICDPHGILLIPDEV